MKSLIAHLISDASGQTVKYASNTALARFSNLQFKKYHWPMIKNINMLNDLLSEIEANPGVVIYTISDAQMRDSLKAFCLKRKIPCISVIGKLVKEIAQYVGVRADEDAGYSNKFDDDYFDKVEAIDFAIRHDDGKMIDDLSEADIILIGPSRTSKTPTSVFLAYNGFKTANIPCIHNCPFPEHLDKLNGPIIFGLVINPSRLIEIRENRISLMQLNSRVNNDYTDMNIVHEECKKIKRICSLNNWQVIDVSCRSIEETSAIIIKSYYERNRLISKI